MNFFNSLNIFNKKISEKVSKLKKNVKDSMSEGVDMLKNVVYEIKNEIKIKTTDKFTLGIVATKELKNISIMTSVFGNLSEHILEII